MSILNTPVEQRKDINGILSALYINRFSFCAPCHLFGVISLAGKEGFSDWEHTQKMYMKS
jgi:hypothetical protein